MLVEEHMIALCGDGVVLDVGGNPSRHQRERRDNVWSCCPILTPSDALRSVNSQLRELANFCEHDAISCRCVEYNRVVCIHSIYYLSPEEIAELVSRSIDKLLYAAVHVYEEPVGQMFGSHGQIPEMTYYVDNEDLVHVQVTGNLGQYVHGSMRWLRRGAIATNRGTLAWSERFRTEHTRVYQFTLTQQVIEPHSDVPMPLTASMHDNDYYGRVDYRSVYLQDDHKAAPVYGTIVAVTDLLSFGPNYAAYLLHNPTTRPVVVPKALVCDVAAAMVGVPRDNKTLRMAVGIAKQQARVLNMPAELRGDAIIYAAYIGFVANLPRETAVLGAMLTDNMNAMQHYNSLLTVDVGQAWWLRAFIADAYAEVTSKPVMYAALATSLSFVLGIRLNSYYRQTNAALSTMVNATGDRWQSVMGATRRLRGWFQPPAIDWWRDPNLLVPGDIASSLSVYPKAVNNYMSVSENMSWNRIVKTADVVIAAPLYEEIGYRLWPNVVRGLFAAEIAITACTKGMMPAIGQLTLHTACAKLPLFPAIGLHMLWNGTVTAITHASCGTIPIFAMTLAVAIGAAWQVNPDRCYYMWNFLVDGIGVRNWPGGNLVRALFERSHLAVDSEPTTITDVAYYDWPRPISDGYTEYLLNLSSFELPDGTVEPVTRMDIPPVTVEDRGEMHPTAVVIPPVNPRFEGPPVAASAIGVVFPVMMPTVPGVNTTNERTALELRHLVNRDTPSPYYLERFVAFVKENLDVLCPHMRHIEAVTFEMWNSRFPLEVQLRHNKAYQELAENPPTKKGKRRGKGFVKIENMLKSTKFGLSKMRPRLIQAKTDWYNVACGPWLYAMSKRLMKSWNLRHFVTYAAGQNSNTLGLWLTLAISLMGENASKNEDDFKEFDASCNRELMELCIWCYGEFGCPRDVSELLIDNLNTWGVTATGVIYMIDATQHSGKPDTSSGNSLLNGLVKVWSAYEQYYQARALVHGLPTFLKTVRIRVLVMGDDGVMIIGPEFSIVAGEYDAMIQRHLGLKPVPQKRSAYWQIKFCSSRFYPVEPVDLRDMLDEKLLMPLDAVDQQPEDMDTVTRFCLAPLPGRIMAKGGFTTASRAINCGQGKRPGYYEHQLLLGNMLGLRDDVAHVPFLREFVNQVIKVSSRHLGKKVEPIYRGTEHKFHVGRVCVPILETWAVIAEAYSVYETDMESFVRDLRRVVSVPCVVSNTVANNFILRDCE